MDLVEVSKGHQQYRHPWELARAESILQISSKLLKNASIADIGAGDCYFAEKINLFAPNRVVAVDIYFERDKIYQNGVFLTRDLDDIPSESLDTIFLMDVLEHVKDDFALLTSCVSKLKSTGTIVITVPAFQALFSPHDISLKHFRRYNLGEIRNLVEKAGLKVHTSSYFYFSLLPIRLFQRLYYGKVEPADIHSTQSNTTSDLSQWPYSDQHLVTRFFVVMLKFDFALGRILHRLGIIAPGLSGLSICRKKLTP